MHKIYEFEDSHYLRSFLEYYPSISESVKSNPKESGLKHTTPYRTIGVQGNTTSSSSSQTPPSGEKTPTSQ